MAELRANRGRPAKPVGEKKEQIALRLDADVLAWYEAMVAGWQTRMNAVLKAYTGTPRCSALRASDLLGEVGQAICCTPFNRPPSMTGYM